MSLGLVTYIVGVETYRVTLGLGNTKKKMLV